MKNFYTYYSNGKAIIAYTNGELSNVDLGRGIDPQFWGKIRDRIEALEINVNPKLWKMV